MHCSNCGFKEEFDKLTNYNFGAVLAVCEKCDCTLDDESAFTKALHENFDKVRDSVMEVYSELKDINSVAELIGVPSELISRIINNPNE